MKLWIDAQLSPKLAPWLENDLPSRHLPFEASASLMQPMTRYSMRHEMQEPS